VTLYRDPLAGLKSQVATKRGLVELRERELAPLMRAMLPAALRRTIDEGRSRVAEVRPRVEGERPGGREREEREEGDDGMNVDALSKLDAELDGLLVAYDEAIAMVPKLRDCPLDVVDPPKPALPPPWLIEENRQRFFRVRFEQRVREVSSEAYIVRWGDVRYLARLDVAGAPVVVTTAGNFDIATTSTEFTSTLRTSVHPSCPPLGVKVQSAMGGVAKVLRLARDDETGDVEFDGAFLVDGRDAGVLLLTSDVRTALRALEPWGAALVVKNGLAEVSWSGAFRGMGVDLLLDAAFSVVLGIRAAIERA
jgi:hypothetical protein